MATVAEAVPSTLLVLWRKVRQLFPVYRAIADCFHFPPAPYADFSEMETGGDDAVLAIAGWIEEIDNLSQPHHLRTVLQELDIASSDMCLSMWLHHFISKPVRGAADRDKIDFLVSHYLRMNLPPSLQEGKPNYAAMKAVLEPVLGTCADALPEEAREVEELIGIAERCRSLAEFEQSGIIRRGRELKLRSGDAYFSAPFLLAFTHFNAVVRKECSRLMNSDLKFIGDALDRLDKQGITHIDCTAANWSDQEEVVALKNKWATWEIDNSDYSTDFFANLIAFRNVVEEALERCIELSMTSVSQELRSIHALLLEMRTQINELPRRLRVAENRPVAAVPTAQTAAPKPNPGQGNVAVAAPRSVVSQGAPAVPAQPGVAKPVAVPPTVVAKPVIPAATAVAAAPVAALAQPGEEKTPVAPSQPISVPKPISAPVQAQPAPVLHAKPSIASAPVSAPAPIAKVPVAAREPGLVEPPKPQVEMPVQPPAPIAASSISVPVKSMPENPVVAPAAAAVNNDVANVAQSMADIDAGIARLQQTLAGKRPAAVSIAVAGTRVLLTGAEASMFAVNDNKFAHAVQRAVMTRICLVSALEIYNKTRDKTAVKTLVLTARTEQTTMRELISECKARKLGREDEILSASGKQLSAMLERAERIAR